MTLLDDSLIYSTEIGGNGHDSILAVAWESDLIYFFGTSSSTNLITMTSNTTLTNYVNMADCFIGVFSSTSCKKENCLFYILVSLQTIGYYGGSEDDAAYDIAVDKYDGSVYVVGATFSQNLPPSITSGTYTTKMWFVTSFSPALGTFIYPFISQQDQILFSVILDGDAEDNYLLSCALYYPLPSHASVLFIAGTTLSKRLPSKYPLQAYDLNYDMYFAAYDTFSM